jgi:hypothetical protein
MNFFNLFFVLKKDILWNQIKKKLIKHKFYKKLKKVKNRDDGD